MTRLLIHIETRLKQAFDGISLVFWGGMLVASAICVFIYDDTPDAITSGCVFIGCSIRFGAQAILNQLKQQEKAGSDG